jgi:predicted Ser/Thr protein kinase
VPEDFSTRSTQPGITPVPPKGIKQPETPTTIGPYKIEGLIEKGGMSLLYLATHPETHEPIIVKVLSPQYISSAEAAQRFLTEAEIIALADHPSIVKLFGYDKWAGGLYIAMEFIHGISLRQYLENTPISLKRALLMSIEIAYAICHLHTHGIIHRDLKPENIIVTESGGVKVIDFGISQMLSTDETKKKEVQQLLGTPVYMSPEQRTNPNAVSYPSDIYSLAIIIYELILGKLSHGQIHLSLMPKGLQKILAKSLQPNPNDRYQDAVDLISDLSAYLNSELFEKDASGDQLHEITEKLQQAQNSIIPRNTPNWPQMDIGVINRKGLSLAALYYDFIELPNNSFGVILTEPTTKGAEGMIYVSILRGMLRILSQQAKPPLEMVTELNKLLCNDEIGQAFTFNYLILMPEKNSYQYISCGFGSLWHIPADTHAPKQFHAENIAIGIDPDVEFKMVTNPWMPGDTLILNTFATTSTRQKREVTFTDAQIDKLLSEIWSQPAQKQVEIIFRKAIATASNEHSIMVSSIKRT